MQYNILGGGQLEATSDFEIVEGLRQLAMAWAPTVSIDDFMVEMADRCKMQKGVFVRADYIPNFVGDLLQYGFIERVDPPRLERTQKSPPLGRAFKSLVLTKLLA